MRVDFYQLTRDPAEAVVPLLARSTLGAGERLVVVSGDDAQLGRISEALWTKLPESFLAHGRAGGEHDARQPILLSASAEAPNGARYALLADGVWRDAALGFDRAFLLFGSETIEAARATWRALDRGDGFERRYWRQDENGKWTQAA